MADNDFLKNIIKDVGNEYASMVSDGVEAGDVDSFIDTGSHVFNALLSGSIYGGLPSNKITAIAGESATGKTFFLMGIVKNFLDKNPNAGVLYFESESAITKQMVIDRGIDPERMVILPVTTVQEFRTQSLKVLDGYLEQPESDRQPLFLCLDSLGMLSTTKEVEDTADGKETRDMTRAQVLKAAFRVLTLKLGRAKVPMVVTNHTYDVVGSMFPQKEMGGGSGLKYAASSIIFLSKKKEKDGTEVIGNLTKVKATKNKMSPPYQKSEFEIIYGVGIDRVSETLQLLHDYELGRKYGKTYTYNDVKYNLEEFKQDILEDVDFYEALKLKIINAIKGVEEEVVIDVDTPPADVIAPEPKLFDKI